jgi:hypothetical protein
MNQGVDAQPAACTKNGWRRQLSSSYAVSEQSLVWDDYARYWYHEP